MLHFAIAEKSLFEVNFKLKNDSGNFTGKR